jgi:hypothetical protein
MIAELASQTLVEGVIVGEPTMMRVSTGHKGVLGLRIHVHGFKVHSSLIESAPFTWRRASSIGTIRKWQCSAASPHDP